MAADERLKWYLRRLRVMTTSEIFHRARQLLNMSSLWLQQRAGLGIARASGEPTRFRFCTADERQLPDLEFDVAALEAATDELLDGAIPGAPGAWRWIDSDEAWLKAPDTGIPWPKSFFGFINYREGNPYGDARKTWEPSRLQHLVDLAVLSLQLEGEQHARAIELCEAQLASWQSANPPLIGPHYISAMECGLRLIAVCHVADILRHETLSEQTWEAVASIASSHAPLIEKRLSLHSSTGNHTVAEAAGLVYAGLLFPEMTGSARRLATGLALLDELSQTQVLPDGGGLEQAFAYHVFNLQILALVQAMLAHHQHPVPAAISEAVIRGRRFTAAMQSVAGRMPPIGDSDDGVALSRFLRFPADEPESISDAQTFEQSGYTVAHIGADPPAGIVFDHGGLGMPPSFGHGHADALSLLLWVDGHEIFIDPGTYTYMGDPAWRHYFRGTPAHNTVTVDNRDQATHEGAFMWSRPVRARLLAADLDALPDGRLLAEHDGYDHLGVRHVRGVAWSSGKWVLAWDRFLGTGMHELALHWHLGIQPRRLDDGSFALTLPRGQLTIQCQGGAVSTHCGEESPIAGWRSPSYGIRVPSPTVTVWHSGPLPHTFTTLVSLRGGESAANTVEDALRWMQDHIR